MRQRSKKFAAKQRQRVKLVATMLEDDPSCHMRSRIVDVDPDYRSCGGWAIGLHEIRKRSAGGSILNPANVVRTCSPCNSWVEDHPLLAREAGLVVRAGDARFDALGQDPQPEGDTP